MVNRLVSVNDAYELPPEIQEALVGPVRSEFEDLTTQAQASATSATSSASAASISRTAAETAAAQAQAAAESATAPTDEAVAGLLANVATESGKEFATRIAPIVVNPTAWGVPANTGVSVSATFQSFLDSLPDYAVVECNPNDIFTFSTTVSINAPMTVRNLHAAPGTNVGDVLVINSSNVSLDGYIIDGATNVGTPQASQFFLRAAGTSSAPLSKVSITNCRMSKNRGSFMRLEWLQDFTVSDNRMVSGQYAGIMMISPKQGKVLNNTVQDMLMTTPLINCYGIAVTDNENTDAARARDVLVQGNFISGMPGWEGIDTHSGINITIVDNTVLNCRTGIAVLVGNSDRTFAPEQCTVANNFIDRRTALTTGYGVTFAGRTDGSLTRTATGTVGANVIIGYATDMQVSEYRPLETTIAPQATDAAIAGQRGPTPGPYRMWTAEGTVTVPANASSATANVTFPTGMFTAAPTVIPIKASGTGARFVPYHTAASATGATIGMFDPSGTGSGASPIVIPYQLLVIQSNSGTSGRGTPYA